MNKLTWFKFVTGAWMKDPQLRACSPAARGLWIDLLCLMSEAPRRGYLEVAPGKPYSDELIAKMTGMSQDEVSRFLSELVTLQVPSRTRKGTLFSRRMSRDETTREDWRERQQKHRSAKRIKKEGHENVTRDNNVTNTVTPTTRKRDRSRVELRDRSDIERDASRNTLMSPPTPLPPSPEGKGAGVVPPEQQSLSNGAGAPLARAQGATAALAPATDVKPLPADVVAAIESFLEEHAPKGKTHDDPDDVDQ